MDNITFFIPSVWQFHQKLPDRIISHLLFLQVSVCNIFQPLIFNIVYSLFNITV